MRKQVVVRTMVIILAVLAVAYVSAVRRGAVSEPALTKAGATSAQAPAEELPGPVMNTSLFRTIAKRENPVVVFITVQSRTRAPDMTQFFGGDDFFSRFFGGPAQPREQIQQGLGSGFLITRDGEILTNNHVVAGAQQIRVGLFSNDRKTYAADVLGRDPLTDSALIRLKNGPSDLPTATLGDSDALEPGDWVMAIGNPFQLGHTVTVGVVSYKGRPFAVTEGRFQNMLQTDASINPGNSGGPLINVRGEVVGINSAILSGEGGGGNIGIGFAVPINTVKTLLPQLRTGKVHRSQLGVQIQSRPITDDEAKQLGLTSADGAIVSMVQHDSPAERAGLQAGDVITEYNGKRVSDADSLTGMVIATAAGTRVPIVFYRHGNRQTANVTVAELQLEEDGQSPRGDDRRSTPGFGLSLNDLTSDIARQLGLPVETSGALVESVEPFTPASEAGVKRGDVILEVNRQAVHSAGSAARELRRLSSGQPAFLLLLREGNRLFVEMRKE
jgi:serine protease Do